MKILLLFTPTKDIQVSFYDITKTIYPALLSSSFFRALLGITVSSDHVGLNLLKVCDVAEVGSPEPRCRESLEYVEELREVQGSRSIAVQSIMRIQVCLIYI